MKVKKLIAMFISVCMFASMLCVNAVVVSAAEELVVPTPGNVIVDSGFEGNLTTQAYTSDGLKPKNDSEVGVWYWSHRSNLGTNTDYGAKLEAVAGATGNALKIEKGASWTDVVYQILPETKTTTGAYKIKFKAKSASETESAKLLVGMIFKEDQFSTERVVQKAFGAKNDTESAVEVGTKWAEYTLEYDIWDRSNWRQYDNSGVKNLCVFIGNISKRGATTSGNTTVDVLVDDFEVIAPEVLQANFVSTKKLSAGGGELEIMFNYEGIYEELINTDNIKLTYADGTAVEGLELENILSSNQYVKSYTSATDVTLANKVKGIKIKYPALDASKGSAALTISNLVSRTPKRDNGGNLTNVYDISMKRYNLNNTMLGLAEDSKKANFVRMDGTQTINLAINTLDEELAVPTPGNVIVDSGFEGNLTTQAYTSNGLKPKSDSEVGMWYWSHRSNLGTNTDYGAKLEAVTGATGNALKIEKGASWTDVVYQILPETKTTTGAYKIKFKAKSASETESAKLLVGMIFKEDQFNTERVVQKSFGAKNDTESAVEVGTQWAEYTLEYDIWDRGSWRQYDNSGVKNLCVFIGNISKRGATTGGDTTVDVLVDDFEVIAPEALQANAISATSLNALGGEIDVMFNYEGIYEELINTENIKLTYADGTAVEGLELENILSSNQYVKSYTSATDVTLANKVKGIKIKYPALDASKGSAVISIENLVSRTPKRDNDGNLTNVYDISMKRYNLNNTMLGLAEDSKKANFVRMDGTQVLTLAVVDDYLVTIATGSEAGKLNIAFSVYDTDYKAIIAQYYRDADGSLTYKNCKIYDYVANIADRNETFDRVEGANYIMVFTWNNLDAMIPYAPAYIYTIE